MAFAIRFRGKTYPYSYFAAFRIACFILDRFKAKYETGLINTDFVKPISGEKIK